MGRIVKESKYYFINLDIKNICIVKQYEHHINKNLKILKEWEYILKIKGWEYSFSIREHLNKRKIELINKCSTIAYEKRKY
jgi:hypothetical protein